MQYKPIARKLTMEPRERIITALSRRMPDKVPLELEFTSPMLKLFKEKTGSTDPYSYFSMDFREVRFKESPKINDFSSYFSHLPVNATITEWGIARVPGSVPYYHRKISPLRYADSLKDIEEYPFPDFTPDYRHKHLEREIRKYHQMGLAVVGNLVMTIFETAWRIRGMENFMMDMVSEPEMAALLLDRITEISSFRAQRLAESGIDIIKLGDDIGTQKSMIMHPDLWRKWLKPRLAEVISTIRKIKPEILILYHSDGYIEPVISDLIEIGVDILNPVQPESMDPVKLKKKYGDCLAFWGTIGIQTTMRHGRLNGLRSAVKHMLETVGKGGGLLIAPAHVIEPDVSWNSILAFVEAVNEYGYYR